MFLSHTDYRKILSYYKIKSDKLTNKQIKNIAENILAEKLCRCIKAVKKNTSLTRKQPIKEVDAIVICNNSVLKKKGIKPNKFTCKTNNKFNKNKLKKYNKTLKI